MAQVLVGAPCNGDATSGPLALSYDDEVTSCTLSSPLARLAMPFIFRDLVPPAASAGGLFTIPSSPKLDPTPLYSADIPIVDPMRVRLLSL